MGAISAEPKALTFRALVEEAGLEEVLRLSRLGTQNRDWILEAIAKLGIADQIDLKATGTRVVFASQEERETYLAGVEFAKQLGITFEGHMDNTDELCKGSNICQEKAKYGSAIIDK
ncbi:hypothetical protein FOBRF1_012094 [Fusarium oxysporum]